MNNVVVVDKDRGVYDLVVKAVDGEEKASTE